MPLWLLAVIAAPITCERAWRAEYPIEQRAWRARCAAGETAEEILAGLSAAAGRPVRGAAGVGLPEGALESVRTALKTDVAALYGDRTREAGAVAAPAAGTVARTPAWAATAPKGFRPPAVPGLDGQKQALTAKLLGRVRGEGAFPEAVAYLKDLYRKNLEPLDVETLRNLERNKVQILILPRDKKVTDLPQFASLKGRRTFDGRSWDSVRGLAGPTDDGTPAAVIGEENLADRGGPRLLRFGGDARGYTFQHEFGHLLHRYGLPKKAPMKNSLQLVRRWRGETPATQQEIEDEYHRSLRVNGTTGLGDYADANEREFFAQAASAYFAVGHRGEDAEKLRRVNPRAYDLLRRAYHPKEGDE